MSRNGLLFTDLQGWCSDTKTAYLMDLVRDTDAQLIVEIGVYGGKSLIPMALVCKEKKSGLCHGIDPWSSEASQEGWAEDNVNGKWWGQLSHDKIYERYRKGVERYGVNNQIVDRVFKSEDIAHEFDDESIDILHLDGNHAEEVAYRDVELYSDKVKRGGYWIFDDINWGTTLKAQRLLEQKGYEIVHTFKRWRVYRRADTPSILTIPK